MKKNKNESIVHIRPDEYYSISAIINNNLISWIGHRDTLRKKIKKNIMLFKPLVIMNGKRTYYRIRGETLIEINQLADKGKLTC